MTVPMLTRLHELQPEMAAIRQDIHAHPELSMQEARTSALVAAKLREWGIPVTEGIGTYGVVGTLTGRRAGQRAIGLRADMDALAITEQTDTPYASVNPGVMHACGHDGHTAMLLAAARCLSENPDFGGTVHFIFQPAEEAVGGARAMVADGLFERFPCDAVYGLHNSPSLPVGQFATRPGPMMAAADRWSATFRGTGGHGGAAPHEASDLSIVQAHFVLALQTIVGRNVPATDTAVISVGCVQGGSSTSVNVMPAELLVAGTARSYREETRALLERRMRELATGLAAAHGCAVEFHYDRGPDAVVNHADQTGVAIAAAAAVAGTQKVDGHMTPSTGGEDFGLMLGLRPGAFMFIGNTEGDPAKAPGLHTPRFDFNDAIIPTGAAYWVSLVQQELSWGGTQLRS